MNLRFGFVLGASLVAVVVGCGNESAGGGARDSGATGGSDASGGNGSALPGTGAGAQVGVGGVTSAGAGGNATPAGVGGSGLEGVGGTSVGGSAPLPMGGSESVASGGTQPGTGGQGGLDTGGAVVPTGGTSEVGSGGILASGGATQPSTGGTPSTPHDDDQPTLIGSIGFSVPSQTFMGQLEVGMSAASETAEIRYTTDGTLPTAASTAYTGTPLAFSETTQLRAQAFNGAEPLGEPSTAIYIRRTFDYTSDIPIVVMEGYGAGKPEDKETWLDLAFMTFEPVDGTSQLANVPALASRAGYHLRGQSSQSFPKVPYRVELWDNDNDDLDYPMMGMPAESDWAMIGPCSDSSLIRNAFVYDLAADMGLSAMRIRFAEVFINQDAGPLEEEDYEGVYAVTETIKNQKNRLDLKQLREDDTALPDISGGYIFKFDQLAVEEGEVELMCTSTETEEEPTDEAPPGGGWGFGGGMVGGCWDDLELVDPDPVNQQQLDWITTHIQTFHDLMHAEPVGDYKAMMDVTSFADIVIINEITRDVDAYIRSHFMHKDRNGLITAGPVWDYNFSLGNISTDLEGWQWEEGRAGSTDWHTVMANDAEFWSAVRARWQALRPGILSDAEVVNRIDGLAAPLLNAGPRDNARWPVGECFSWNVFGPGSGDEQTTFTGDGTWEGEVQVLKDWTLARMAWIDSQLL